MAKVFISEYVNMPIINGGIVPVGDEPGVATQVVAIGAGSAQSAAFNAKTRFVRVHADAVCSILFGVNPTATADSPRIAAGASEFFGVTPGHKVAVITNT